jgi:hypothetical protein
MRFPKWTRLAAPLLSLAAVGLVIGLPNIAMGDEGRRDFNTTLSSFHETPTLSTEATGTLRLQLTPQEIDYTLTFNNLSSAVLFAHIHLGENHITGGVIAFLCGGGGKPVCSTTTEQTSGTISGKIVAADILPPTAPRLAVPNPVNQAQGLAAGDLAGAERAIRAGAVYGNVHSSTFPAGEIRGQLLAGGDRD